MKKKKKTTVRIVDKSSINYTFTDNNLVYNQTTEPRKERLDQKAAKVTKKSIMDIKDQNRHKVNSRNIKSLQGHSPVYE